MLSGAEVGAAVPSEAGVAATVADIRQMLAITEEILVADLETKEKLRTIYCMGSIVYRLPLKTTMNKKGDKRVFVKEVRGCCSVFY